jgi:two-component system, NarL family, sensor histidine kinase UhpB
MKKLICFIALFHLAGYELMAQLHKSSVGNMPLNIDSILAVISNPGNDSGKVNAYHMMGAITAGTDANKAIEYSKLGIVLSKAIDYPSGMAVCMLNASYCYGLLNNFPEAIKYIDSSILCYKKIGKTNRLAFCYRLRAENNQKIGKLRQALNDCDTAMRYSDMTKNNSIKKNLYKTMAAVYYDQNDLVQSKIFYEKAYAGHSLAKDSIPMADILNKVGNIYQQEGKYDQSIGNFEKAIRIAISIREENNLSEYYKNLSNTWLKKGDKRKAEWNAQKAISYAKAKKNRQQLAEAQSMLSAVYLDKDSTAAAITAAKESYALAGDISSRETQLISAEALANGFYKAGEYRKAFDYLQISKTINDSFVAEKYNADVTTLQTSFKVNEKDREILLLNKDKALQLQEIKQQRLIMLGAAAIALLSLAGIWLFLGRNKLRARMKELELRNRIAADLHDEVGSSLSSIHMLSQMATQTGNETTHKDILQRMSNNAKETMDKMGDIVWMIKPGETESSSLKQRMERFAYEICSTRNIEISMELKDLEKIKLTMAQRKNIYLIFKEALNNAVKYSGTDKIEVVVSAIANKFILLVKDFGRGFNSKLVQKGNGLENMQQRAKEMGGKIDFDMVSNKGASVQLIIQLNKTLNV